MLRSPNFKEREMKHYVRFVERQFPAKANAAEVYINDVCVGEWHWTFNRDKVYYELPTTGRFSIMRTTMADCAKQLVKSGMFNRDYDYWDGACHYYFDTKDGYKHIEEYNRCFPEVAEYLIIIDDEEE